MLLAFAVILMISALEANRCPKHCAGIDRYGDEACDKTTLACLEGCEMGFYGNACNLTCDVNCLNKSCQQNNGVCICRTGYERLFGKCQNTKGTRCVFKNGHCIANICKPGGRKQCVYGCVAGWFGEFCDKNCSKTCVCDQESGTCTGCVAGWFGSECQFPCSSHCHESNCHRNGSCKQGCKDGSYGERCELYCSQHCVSGCDQLLGECVQCEAGWYGSTCQYACSAGCAGVNRNCDRDGRCGCVKGYYGEQCEFNCPHYCSKDLCDANGTCSVCKNGYFGSFCLQTCLKCADEMCNQTTGVCTIGCQAGYYGSICNLTCEHCKDGECDMNTGKCTGTWMPYIIGGGVLLSIVLLAVFIACCLKRIHNVIYIDVKWRRRSQNAVQDVSAVASPGQDEDIIVPPPTVCPIGPKRQTSYLRPRQSGSSANNLQIRVQVAEVSDVKEDELQVPTASPENLPPSDRRIHNVLGRSNEWLDRPASYVQPNYSELNEDLMDSHPQQTQGAEAPGPVLNNSPLSSVAYVYTYPGGEKATEGEVSIPLIAECFGTTDAEETESDKKSLPENYDHPFKDYMQF